jgi:ABC-type branched-subunit amino acid transport system substrate-binding protein
MGAVISHCRVDDDPEEGAEMVSSHVINGMRTTRRRPLSLAAATLAAAALLAACGDDAGGGSSAGGGGGDCTAPGVTGDSVKLALIAPLTGPASTNFAGFADAAQARIDKQNEDGGVAGRQIELVRLDDMGDGAAQTTAAREAIQSENVFGIISASRVDTMYDYLGGQGVPVAGLMTPLAYSEDENVFGYAGASNIGYANTNTIERLQQAGVTRLAVLAHNSPAAVAGVENLRKVADELGLEIVVQALDIPLGSFDATAQAIQMREADADGIDGLLLTDSSVSVIQAARSQGLEFQGALFSGLYNPEAADAVSDDIQGALTILTGLVPTEVDTPEMAEYLQAMETYVPDAEPSGQFTGGGYVSADLFIRGIEEATEANGEDCLTREGFIESLRAVSDYDGAGLIPEPISFNGGPTPNGGTPYDRCSWFVVREGNAWVPDPEPTCGEYI